MNEYVNDIKNVSADDFDLRVSQLYHWVQSGGFYYPGINSNFCLIVDSGLTQEYELKEISDQNLKDIVIAYNKMFSQYLSTKENDNSITEPSLQLRKISCPDSHLKLFYPERFYHMILSLEMKNKHEHSRAKSEIVLSDELAREYIEFFAATTKFRNSRQEYVPEFVSPSSEYIKG